MADYIDLITGNPLEPWAQQMMDRKDAQPEAARVEWIKAPLPAGVRDTPELRARLRADEAALATAPASSVADGRLREALEQAANWFDEYSQLHSAKGTEDALAKAYANYEKANFCRAALQPAAASEEVRG